MDGLLYYGSLLLIVSLAYMFFQNNNSLLLLICVAIGIYIVYTHETGHTATEFKNDMVNSINEEAEGFNEKKGIERFDPQKMKDEVDH
jgi:ABC-type transport system involved in Fe-S cluster assembly fused permease/ATPase subunit